MIELMTTEQYRLTVKPPNKITKKPVSQQAIRKAIKNALEKGKVKGKYPALPHVKKITRSGWIHMLHVQKPQPKNETTKSKAK